MVRIPWLLAVVLGACTPSFEAKSIVIDLRILGLRADPPEVVEDFDVANPVLPEVPPIEVTALVADPGAERRLAWRMEACPPHRMRRCREGDVVVPMGEGVVDDPDAPGSTPIRAALAATPELLLAAFEGDQDLGFGGLQVMTVLTVWPEEEPAAAVVGAKMLLYAPRIPAGRTPNQNPALTAVRVDDADDWLDDGQCREITAGIELRLEPVEPPDARETYLLPTLEGGERMITENLRYSWFASAGSFSAEQTGGPVDFFGNPPPLHTRYTPPEETPTEVKLWIVQRDERGGTSFARRCVAVSAAP